MNGQISEHPLLEVIREIQGKRFLGVLRLQREGVKSNIYFDAGQITFGISNLRAHRLDVWLVQSGAVSTEQLAEAQKHSATELELLAFLLNSGMVPREQMTAALMSRTTEILRTSLLWPNGEWAFDANVRPAQEAHPPINSGELLVERARRLPPELIPTRFSNPAEKFSADKQAATISINLQPMEGFVLSRADQPATAEEIMTLCGLPETEVLRALYVLSLGGFLQRTSWIAVLESKPATLQATQPQLAVEAKPIRKEVPKEVDEKTMMEELFRLAENTDYYQVLGVDEHADQEKIKQAYYALAKKYHPDRFHQKDHPELRARIEHAFTQIKKAYDTLKKEASRAKYDDAHHSTSAKAADAMESDSTSMPEHPMTPPEVIINPPSFISSNPAVMAEEKFKQGVREFENGNDTLALARFSEAVQMARQEARYHAFYGRALARNPQTRKMAETEFLEAISLDERNIDYRLLLAELYRDLKLKRRAEAQLSQALTINPQRADVRQRLNELRSA